MGTIIQKIEIEQTLEGRGWMRYAVEIFGAKIRSSLHPKKFYLHQMYTTVFLEFETKEGMLKCKNGMKQYDDYWNYDPVAEIDMNQAKDRAVWGIHSIEFENYRKEDIIRENL